MSVPVYYYGELDRQDVTWFYTHWLTMQERRELSGIDYKYSFRERLRYCWNYLRWWMTYGRRKDRFGRKGDERELLSTSKD